MRIVHFAETLRGGPATHLNELLPFQVDQYDHVSVFCPEDQVHDLNVAGIHMVTFPPVDRTLLGLLKLARNWRAHLATNRYDVVHLHSSFAGFVGRILRAPKGTKVVYCARGWSFAIKTSQFKKYIYAAAERLLSINTDAIINISKNEHDLALRYGIPAQKSVLVYNGVADFPWAPRDRNDVPTKLLFVGRYDKQKGVDVLLEAMTYLPQGRYQLTLAGGKVLKSGDSVSMPPNVVDRGWQTPSEIRTLMQDADIVVMPSRWEGFGFVAAEAMRAGRPVVASAVGGLTDIVLPGETGVLCAPENPSALADAIRSLEGLSLTDMGKKARSRYEEMFTSRRMYREIDAVYERLLS